MTDKLIFQRWHVTVDGVKAPYGFSSVDDALSYARQRAADNCKVQIVEERETVIWQGE